MEAMLHVTLDPTAPPFWEQDRGGGAVTDVLERRRRYARLREIRAWLVVIRDEYADLAGKGKVHRRQTRRRELQDQYDELRAEALRLDPACGDSLVELREHHRQGTS